jgi:hypothetical protein
VARGSGSRVPTAVDEEPAVSSLFDLIEEHLPGRGDEPVPVEAAWRGLTLASGVLSALLARRLVAALWARAKGTDHPMDPSDRSTNWSTALAWAVASGVGVGVARVVGQRTAARVWETATGSSPPGVNAEPALEG